ncbi:hypothetical protein Tco_1486689 [Tanacetum coccineum]
MIPQMPDQKFDGISLIATYLGKPIMLDSYTSAMCKDSWGRSSFARCLIESNSEANLKESITISIPDLDGPGFTKETIRDSVGNNLPKGVPVVKGFQVGKYFAFQPRDPKAGSNSGGGNTGHMKMSNITTPNPFTVLGEDEEEEVENIWDEFEKLNLQNTGASTPAYTVPDV